MGRLIPDRFILALLATVLLASVLPASGDAALYVGYVATAAVVLLFFLHGVRMPRENLVAALSNWRLHLLILATTFAIFPAAGRRPGPGLAGTAAGSTLGRRTLPVRPAIHGTDIHRLYVHRQGQCRRQRRLCRPVQPAGHCADAAAGRITAARPWAAP